MPNAKMKRPRAVTILAKYELDEIDKKILQLKMQYPAINDGEVAKIIGIAPKTLSVRIHAQKWQDAFSELHLPAKSLLEKNAARLTKKYIRLADCGDKKVEERVIRTI